LRVRITNFLVVAFDRSAMSSPSEDPCEKPNAGGQEAGPSRSPCAVPHDQSTPTQDSPMTTSSPCADLAETPTRLSQQQQQEGEVHATSCDMCPDCTEFFGKQEVQDLLAENLKDLRAENAELQKMTEEISKKNSELKAKEERLLRELDELKKRKDLLEEPSDSDAHSPTSLTPRAERKDGPWPSPELDAMIKVVGGQLEEIAKKHNINASTDPSQLQVGPEDKLSMQRIMTSIVLLAKAKESYQNARAYSGIRVMEDMWKYGLEGKAGQEEGRGLPISSTTDDTPESHSSGAQRTVDPSDPFLAPVSLEMREDLPTVDDPVFSAFSPAVRTFCSAICSGEIPERVPSELEDITGPFTFLHLWLQYHGYYGHFSKETARDIALNVGDGTVLDPLAGNGWAVKALREAGVRTIASDERSDSPFEQLDAMDALKKYGDQITHLLISWAPHRSDIDVQLLREVGAKYPHVTIINVGEDQGGCTGSEQFWREAKRVTPKFPVRYQRTSGVYDNLTFVTWVAEADRESQDGRDQCIVF